MGEVIPIHSCFERRRVRHQPALRTERYQVMAALQRHAASVRELWTVLDTLDELIDVEEGAVSRRHDEERAILMRSFPRLRCPCEQG